MSIVTVDKDSINALIKRMKQIRNKYPKMVKEFLKRTRIWIMEEANDILYRSDIGYNIKATIISQWRLPPIEGYTCQLINEDSSGDGENKAVFVEFGVGSVGGSSPHPLAFENGYDYNVPSQYKGSGSKDPNEWSFYANVEDLDIPKSAITNQFSVKGSIRSTYTTKSGDIHQYADTRDRSLVYTKGTQGVLFLYNALTNFKSQGIAKQIWQEVCEEYIK